MKSPAQDIVDLQEKVRPVYFLEPCPFCGGRARLETHHRAFINAQTTKVAFVRCTQCEARSGRFELRDYGRTSHSHEANKNAIAAWNRRSREKEKQPED